MERNDRKKCVELKCIMGKMRQATFLSAEKRLGPTKAILATKIP